MQVVPMFYFFGLVFVLINPLQGAVIKDEGLLKKPNSDVILTMNQPVQPIIKSFSKSLWPSRSAKISSFVNTLEGFSRMSQAPVLAQLESFDNVQTQSFWISNQILVRNATPDVIQKMSTSPLISEISEDISFPVLPVWNVTVGRPPNGPEWGIKKIGASELWAKKIRGQGIVVASIDTGVRWTHNSLKDNFVGVPNYGWFDPLLNLVEPYDLNGHGTHTVGTIAGNDGIGVAPKAKWMACKGCDALRCFQSALLSCGQFVLCPHDTQGFNKDCTKTPHIVSNSWGGGTEDDYYNPVINAWKAADIIPIFAIGNSGPKCASTSAPGNQRHVIAVGSTDKQDKLSKFSSRGPNTKSYIEGIKPEVLAPGQDVSSAFLLTDSSYHILSGTSMACPHTAGAAALLLSANPNLRLEDVMELLTETTEKNVVMKEGDPCGSIPVGKFPNYMFGHGRINVEAAYNKLITNPKYKSLLPRQKLGAPEIQITKPPNLLSAIGLSTLVPPSSESEESESTEISQS